LMVVVSGRMQVGEESVNLWARGPYAKDVRKP
jgi:hypothetical protein